MIISTSRPYFAPYAGFFAKALMSDVVVLLDIETKGQQLIIDICKRTGANEYLVQPSTAGYYDSQRFTDNGITLVKTDIPKLVYPQLWGDFIYNLSVFDLLLNCGPKSKDLIACAS